MPYAHKTFLEFQKHAERAQKDADWAQDLAHYWRLKALKENSRYAENYYVEKRMEELRAKWPGKRME